MTGPATLILLSGGLDSSTLLWYLKKSKGRRVEALFVDRGQENLVQESQAAAKVCAFDPANPVPLHCTTVSEWWRYMKGHVEMIHIPRNALFSILALPLALGGGFERIALGSNATDHSGDSSAASVPVMSNMLRLTQNTVTLEAPFHDEKWSKKDVAIWAKENLGTDFLSLTFSCWKPHNQRACDTCTACISRADALSAC